MTGVRNLKAKLRHVQQQQADCLNEHNIVKFNKLQEYKQLTHKARHLRNEIVELQESKK